MAGVEVSLSLPLALLPLGCPKIRLRFVDDLLGSQDKAIFRHRNFYVVTDINSRGTPQGSWQCNLPTSSHFYQLIHLDFLFQ